MSAPQHVTVAIVGAGIGGLALAIGLLEDGVDDFVILERGDGVGGTWRHNTYPGAACDVPSHLYSFSFASNPNWSRTYAKQPEILEYLEACATDRGVRPHLRTGWHVTAATFDDTSLRWTVTSAAGETLLADVVVFATGTFDEPKLPMIDGIDSFAGDLIHSARWDHAVELDGRRVGIIGTGASGVQIIPEVAAVAEHLTVFQRTAPYVLPRHDPPFTEQQRQAFIDDPASLSALRLELYERFEGTTLYVAGDPVAQIVTKLAHEHLHDAVADPVLRAKLTPDYPLGCNRTLVSSDLYPALQRHNVSLVTDPINRVTSTGIETVDGEVHDLDALVLATGFATDTYLHGIDVIGTGGRALHDEWGQSPRAYLGMTVTGFPNMFIFYGPNTNQGGNSIILILEAQATYVRDVLAKRTEHHFDALDVKASVMETYDTETQALMASTVWVSGCSTYFTNADGRVVTQLPHTSGWYAQRTASVELDDFTLLSRS